MDIQGTLPLQKQQHLEQWFSDPLVPKTLLRTRIDPKRKTTQRWFQMEEKFLNYFLGDFAYRR